MFADFHLRDNNIVWELVVRAISARRLVPMASHAAMEIHALTATLPAKMVRSAK